MAAAVAAPFDDQTLSDGCAGTSKNSGDFLADQLVALEQRVAQRVDEVAVGLEQCTRPAL